ncbi:TadE family type IV pilus minor pilin [Leifsonia sp. NPDC077715]|uniref:TadE family type IV pilus minor pilin n=1 Tax=Leifsonia sp. NPDC077715 TaxID=3155539 RepID=UPI00341C345A
MRWPEGDRGSVSAEFAVALPAVLGCLALCVGGIAGAAQYAALAGSAAVAARLAGRGDDPGGAGAPAGSTVGIEREGGLVCVSSTASGDTTLSRLGIRLSARACALDESIAP